MELQAESHQVNSIVLIYIGPMIWDSGFVLVFTSLEHVLCKSLMFCSRNNQQLKPHQPSGLIIFISKNLQDLFSKHCRKKKDGLTDTQNEKHSANTLFQVMGRRMFCFVFHIVFLGFLLVTNLPRCASSYRKSAFQYCTKEIIFSCFLLKIQLCFSFVQSKIFPSLILGLIPLRSLKGHLDSIWFAGLLFSTR